MNLVVDKCLENVLCGLKPYVVEQIKLQLLFPPNDTYEKVNVRNPDEWDVQYLLQFYSDRWSLFSEDLESEGKLSKIYSRRLSGFAKELILIRNKYSHSSVIEKIGISDVMTCIECSYWLIDYYYHKGKIYDKQYYDVIEEQRLSMLHQVVADQQHHQNFINYNSNNNNNNNNNNSSNGNDIFRVCVGDALENLLHALKPYVFNQLCNYNMNVDIKHPDKWDVYYLLSLLRNNWETTAFNDDFDNYFNQSIANLNENNNNNHNNQLCKIYNNRMIGYIRELLEIRNNYTHSSVLVKIDVVNARRCVEGCCKIIDFYGNMGKLLDKMNYDFAQQQRLFFATAYHHHYLTHNLNNNNNNNNNNHNEDSMMID